MKTITMRQPCPKCKYAMGIIETVNGQDTVRCGQCKRGCYSLLGDGSRAGSASVSAIRPVAARFRSVAAARRAQPLPERFVRQAAIDAWFWRQQHSHPAIGDQCGEPTIDDHVTSAAKQNDVLSVIVARVAILVMAIGSGLFLASSAQTDHRESTTRTISLGVRIGDIAFPERMRLSGHNPTFLSPIMTVRSVNAILPLELVAGWAQPCCEAVLGFASAVFAGVHHDMIVKTNCVRCNLCFGRDG